MCRLLAIAILAVGALSCRRAKEPVAQPAPPIKPAANAPADPAVPPSTAAPRTAPATRIDPDKPLLSAPRVEKLIASMKEGHNPLLAQFAPSGALLDLETQAERRAEFDAFARRYGFADHEDYLYAWGRVEGIVIARRAATARIRELEAKASRTADEEEQLASLRRGPGYNAADAALVAQYEAAYNDASQRYRASK
jgi:hypothetical protein